MVANIDMGGTGGGGTLDADDDPWADDSGGSTSGSDDSADDSTASTTTFDPSDQTLGDGMVDTTDDDPDPIEVDDSDSDPDASSPAGGQGETSAVADLIGEDESVVEDYAAQEGQDALDLGQQASDEWTARRRLARSLGIETDAAESVGSIFTGEGLLAEQGAAQQEAIDALDNPGEEILANLPDAFGELFETDAIDLPRGALFAVVLVLVLGGGAFAVHRNGGLPS
ncbi:hypothetical protein [Haloparvum sedimenti]|uniref:hypothetical protein n=1 Tax=Haloparvum sedimenti TaxID=1678448 RepID=UPI00071E9D77|nr:hypothetical protein [Haloparvum sedimenti]